MINFYTQVNVNETFNQEVLLEMFFAWMNATKINKMETLNYQNEVSYICDEEKKKLRIEDFKENKVFGVQFTTSDNNRHAQFVVEVMYDYGNQTLGLGFYKEMLKDSTYFPSMNLPKIFIQLLQSSYVLSDNELVIKNEPHFYQRKEFSALLKSKLQLPMVVLKKNQRCLVNPFILAERLFGLAHVVCVNTKEEPTMEIYYPNKGLQSISLQKEPEMMNVCYDMLLDYCIQTNTQSYTFDELVSARMYHSQMDSKELEQYYDESLKELKEEVNEYNQLFQQTFDEYQRLKKEKEALENYVAILKKEKLLVATDNVEQKQKLILDLLGEALKTCNVKNGDRYRRKDIILSILEEV